MQLSIYPYNAMMSFVSGYYGAIFRQQRTGHPRLHFTKHDISQIHEGRTVSRAVVKLLWNFDRNYRPLLCTRVRCYFPAVSFSFHADPRFIPMKLSTPSRDIRFQPVGIGLYIKSIFRGNSRVAFKRPFYYDYTSWDARAITYGAVDTIPFRGDWIVIDCGIIPGWWNR